MRVLHLQNYSDIIHIINADPNLFLIKELSQNPHLAPASGYCEEFSDFN